LVLHFLPNGLERIRVGIIVSRRFGGAVRRNRLRRRLREAVRAQGWRRGAGFDLVVAPRERAAGASFAEMRDAMAAVLRGAGLVATGDLT
jgi:ribonuclease P protein component